MSVAIHAHKQTAAYTTTNTTRGLFVPHTHTFLTPLHLHTFTPHTFFKHSTTHQPVDLFNHVLSEPHRQLLAVCSQGGDGVMDVGDHPPGA